MAIKNNIIKKETMERKEGRGFRGRLLLIL